MTNHVILVDENDCPKGTMEKMKAHQKGALHRAFSIFIFDEKGDLLMQKRSMSKYHSAGLWTNTCCSHPRPHEKTLDAAQRRLKEEMGMETELFPLFTFTYFAELDNDLIEHELDHVFYGVSNTLPIPDPSEVSDWKYMSAENLQKDLLIHGANYTEWFKICIDRVMGSVKSMKWAS